MCVWYKFAYANLKQSKEETEEKTNAATKRYRRQRQTTTHGWNDGIISTENLLNTCTTTTTIPHDILFDGSSATEQKATTTFRKIREKNYTQLRYYSSRLHCVFFVYFWFCCCFYFLSTHWKFGVKYMKKKREKNWQNKSGEICAHFIFG